MLNIILASLWPHYALLFRLWRPIDSTIMYSHRSKDYLQPIQCWLVNVAEIDKGYNYNFSIQEQFQLTWFEELRDGFLQLCTLPCGSSNSNISRSSYIKQAEAVISTYFLSLCLQIWVQEYHFKCWLVLRVVESIPATIRSICEQTFGWVVNNPCNGM